MFCVHELLKRIYLHAKLYASKKFMLSIIVDLDMTLIISEKIVDTNVGV